MNRIRLMERRRAAEGVAESGPEKLLRIISMPGTPQGPSPSCQPHPRGFIDRAPWGGGMRIGCAF